MPPLLILDTSVLIAALRSSNGASYALLRLVGAGRFEIGVTTALVLEYESVATRSLGALAMTADDLGDLLDYLCRVGRRAAVRFRVRPSLADPGDELVLEAAVACGAEWIVTHNVRHMAAGAGRFGVEVLTPGEACGAWGWGMSELRIELPPDVRAQVARRAGGDPAAEAAWVADAVRERLAVLAELEYLDARAARGSREAFERRAGQGTRNGPGAWG